MRILERAEFLNLQSKLNATVMRQQVNVNNIANASTPYYKRESVKFEELLQQQLSGSTRIVAGKLTNARHIPLGRTYHMDRIGQPTRLIQPEIVRDDSETLMNNDHNNVDIEYEMSQLAKNQLQYNLTVEQINNQIRVYRTAIGGR